jgi:hypothetical protein
LQEAIALLQSPSIHGGGVGSINGIYASEHNIAIGQATYSGTVRGEIFGGTGQYATAFKEIVKRAMGATTADNSMRDAGFDKTTQLVLSPGGGGEFRFPDSTLSVGKAVVQTFTLNGNMGGVSSFDAAIMSSGADFAESGAPNAPTIANFSFETGGLADDSNPLPYWATQFNVTGTGEDDLADRITAWSLNINNNSVPIFTFNGTNFAVDVLQGRMEVTGSFSYYMPTGKFKRNLVHGGRLTISLGTYQITSPFVAFGPYPVPAPGPNEPTVRNVTFRCLASASEASIHIV